MFTDSDYKRYREVVHSQRIQKDHSLNSLYSNNAASRMFHFLRNHTLTCIPFASFLHEQKSIMPTSETGKNHSKQHLGKQCGNQCNTLRWSDRLTWQWKMDHLKFPTSEVSWLTLKSWFWSKKCGLWNQNDIFFSDILLFLVWKALQPQPPLTP